MGHRKRRGAAISAFLLGVLAHAQAPPSADTLLDLAKAQAGASQRAIFVIFHASW